LLDRYVLASVGSALRLGFDAGAGAMLMIESDAGGDLARHELTVAGQACRAVGATSEIHASEPEKADALREARRKAHWSMAQAGAARTDDVSVPRSRSAELMDAIEQVGRRHGMDIGVFGHAGDGNYHPTYVTAADDVAAATRIDAVRADLYAEVLALGGSISGEHGTGLTKRSYLEAQVGPRALDVMRAIKAALDPGGILNPGKLLPD
jgi:glycolate oxidase